MSNYTGQNPELYYALPAAVTKNTYTTIAPISAIAGSSIPRAIIPANYFSMIGKSLSFRARGTIQSAAGTATFLWTGGLDSTQGTLGKTIFATPTLTPATGTAIFDLEGDITAQAVGQAGTTLQCNGSVRVAGTTAAAWLTSLSATGGAAVKSEFEFSTSITALDNEVNQYLELFGTWSASSATNSTVLQQFKVYLEN